MNPAIDLGATVESVNPDVKLRCSTPSIGPGGGGVNVARALNLIHGESTAIFPEGSWLGRFYRGLVEAEGVDCKTFETERPMHRINAHFRETESHHQYRFNLPGAELEESDWQGALKLLSDMLEEDAILVMSGSLPPGVPEELSGLVAEAVRRARACLVLDAPGEVLKELKNNPVSWITPNQREFESLIGHEVADGQLEEELGSLVEHTAFENVLLTLGEKGAFCAGTEGIWNVPAPNVDKVSSVGAGDSAVAGLVLGLAKGEDHRTASRWAVAAGAAAVQSPETELLREKDFEELCDLVSKS